MHVSRSDCDGAAEAIVPMSFFSMQNSRRTHGRETSLPPPLSLQVGHFVVVIEEGDFIVQVQPIAIYIYVSESVWSKTEGMFSRFPFVVIGTDANPRGRGRLITYKLLAASAANQMRNLLIFLTLLLVLLPLLLVTLLLCLVMVMIIIIIILIMITII